MNGGLVYKHVYPRPTYPRASTFENAIVGVGGAPKPMKDRVLPLDWKVETRGVDRLGNGTAPGKCDVNVIVEGVRVVKFGEGGKTNKVCDGVEAAEVESTPIGAFRNALSRRRSGGMRRRDSARSRVGCVITWGVTASSATSAIGEEGTGERILRLTGRFFCLGRGRVSS